MKTYYRYIQAPLFAAAMIAVCLFGCAKKAVHHPTEATGSAAADDGCGAADILMESVDRAGEQATITAVPKSGYEFVRWTGGKVADSASAVTAVTVRSNMEITAVFREIPSDGSSYNTGFRLALPGS